MVAARGPFGKVLIVNSGSGGAAAARDRLLAAFPGHELIDLEPGQDLAAAYAAHPSTSDAQVVVAGGDGTVGAAIRCLAGSRQTLGIIPTGTFNNVSRGLGLPLDLEEAIGVVKTGRPRPIAIGRAGGLPFVEAAGVGVFGEGILLGEALKELRAGELLERLLSLAGQEPFRYRLSGDVTASGRATSIVVANTPTVGAGIAVAGVLPTEARLEVNVQAHMSRSAALAGLLVGLLRPRAGRPGRRYLVQRLRIETVPRTPVFADVLEAGTTPIDFEVEPGAVQVILPERDAGSVPEPAPGGAAPGDRPAT